MAATEITVLKNNVPWGPFTRRQIDDGLARGDYTVKYLAHAPGLKEWLPLGEVLHYVDEIEGPRPSYLPPVPDLRELPPVPGSTAPIPNFSARPTQPPVLSSPTPQPKIEPIAPPPPLPASPLEEKEKIESEIDLKPASFFLRGFAFVIDCAILFVPVGILFILGALAIEIPAAWHHIPHQSRMEEWDFLEMNTQRLAWLVAIGFGWLYGAGLESSRRQATIGKSWMGVKVTDARGERLSFLHATGRYAAKYLSALPCFLGFIVALFSSRGITWHDRLADTRVVRN
jgi:uncharacterized RDD family membrane protein YckC